MCNHENREANMTLISPEIWCDPCLSPLVKALNEGGMPTIASCCGHGTHYGSVVLADWRVLMVLPNLASLEAVGSTIVTEPDSTL